MLNKLKNIDQTRPQKSKAILNKHIFLFEKRSLTFLQYWVSYRLDCNDYIIFNTVIVVPSPLGLEPTLRRVFK
jgi:hypothetical protein